MGYQCLLMDNGRIRYSRYTYYALGVSIFHTEMYEYLLAGLSTYNFLNLAAHRILQLMHQSAAPEFLVLFHSPIFLKNRIFGNLERTYV